MADSKVAKRPAQRRASASKLSALPTPPVALKDKPVKSIQKWLHHVEPAYAGKEVTKDLDLNSILVLAAFMLGWRPLDPPPGCLVQTSSACSQTFVEDSGPHACPQIFEQYFLQAIPGSVYTVYLYNI